MSATIGIPCEGPVSDYIRLPVEASMRAEAIKIFMYKNWRNNQNVG